MKIKVTIFFMKKLNNLQIALCKSQADHKIIKEKWPKVLLTIFLKFIRNSKSKNNGCRIKWCPYSYDDIIRKLCNQGAYTTTSHYSSS